VDVQTTSTEQRSPFQLACFRSAPARTLSGAHSKSAFYAAFVWARTALNRPKWRVSGPGSGHADCVEVLVRAGCDTTIGALDGPKSSSVSPDGPKSNGGVITNNTRGPTGEQLARNAGQTAVLKRLERLRAAGVRRKVGSPQVQPEPLQPVVEPHLGSIWEPQPGVVPICSGGHACSPSAYKSGPHASAGWTCNSCGWSFNVALSSSHPSAERWFCRTCGDDYCFRCFPRVPACGQEVAEQVEVPAAVAKKKRKKRKKRKKKLWRPPSPGGPPRQAAAAVGGGPPPPEGARGQ
jgi:hypothetical protein